MELALPPPPQFLSLPGEPPVPWVHWLESFENYITALGLSVKDDARKRALLIHCLGIEGQQMFRMLGGGQAKKYKDATKLLEAHFAGGAHAQEPPDDLTIGKLWREFQNMKSQMTVLEQQNEDLLSKKKVAFSASLLSTGEGNIYANGENLVYKKVFTNVGEGYNPNTGVFTAPVRGVYFFRFYAHCHGGNKMAVSLYKEGKKQCSIFNEIPRTNGNASNAVVLTLEKGEEVYTRMWEGTWVYDDSSSYTSFTGFLLFSMEHNTDAEGQRYACCRTHAWAHFLHEHSEHVRDEAVLLLLGSTHAHFASLMQPQCIKLAKCVCTLPSKSSTYCTCPFSCDFYVNFLEGGRTPGRSVCTVKY
ncbi:uncharacterized protein LOC134437682 [Engraulis encrasicolus]|uniref:uncharacterized protein LOC134437682 n=1 Tax=Engraulis encrasicolus TaxID=184585 RepID=UPI002FD4443B